MAQFNPAEWQDINTTLNTNEALYGMPQKQQNSLVFASFNIRKFGAHLNKDGSSKRSAGAWDLITKFCERCDLIAIQEVMDRLDSLRELQRRLGPNYKFIVSDITGGLPGKQGLKERLAFVYDSERLELREMASDLSFERSAIFNQLYEKQIDFTKAFQERAADLRAWQAKVDAAVLVGKRKPTKPPFVLPHFVQFIRSPHVASFRIPGTGQAEPYEFTCINAHLLYGNKSRQKHERYNEFKALLGWLIDRAKEEDRNYSGNMLLLGDLNLDAASSSSKRRAVVEFIKSLNQKVLGEKVKVNFPFLDDHPSIGRINTNARKSETFDQIAIFARDRRLPPPHQNDEAGKKGLDAFDYGVFDFVKLFEDAIPSIISNGKTNYKLFEFDLSDHMPIWIRLTKPHENQAHFRWR